MSEKKIEIKAIKIGLLGDSKVGKSAICHSFTNVEFDFGSNVTTIGSDRFESKVLLKNNKEIKLILWDTAGQERFRSAAFKTIKSVHGIALVFDVTSKESFNNVSLWLDDIKDNFDNPCIVLFGNKIDIEKDKWEVKPEEVKQLVEERKLSYFETSAKNKIGINEGFIHIANEAYVKLGGKLEEPENKIELNGKKKRKKSGGCFGGKNKDKEKK